MIPLSMLRKRNENTETAVATDAADCGCACDAAPKKPQTLEQHLKQYHHGQMPKGDCSWLKQYKKDHPDWQKDAAKVSKGEAAVDTAKKDASGAKKDFDAEDMTVGDVIEALKENPMFKTTSPKKGEMSVRIADGYKKFLKGKTGGWDVLNQMKKSWGSDAVEKLGTPSVFDDHIVFDGINFETGKKMSKGDKLIAKLKEGYRRGGEKKDYASEYLDAVEKDRKSKKSEKKDSKDSDVRLPNYPSKEDMKKNFDFDKVEKGVWGEMSKLDYIKDMDADIFGDGKLSLSFTMANGGQFGKGATDLLGNAMEKMGIPRSAIETPSQSGDKATVAVKLDALINKALAHGDDEDTGSPEYIVDVHSESDIEAMFSDDTRKLCVANARKQAKRDGYNQFILWSPSLGWSYARDYKQEDSFKEDGQEIMGKVEIVNDGNIQYPEFHVNTDFDRMKPVKHYEAIQKVLEAKKKELEGK